MLIQGPITSKKVASSAEVLAAGLRAEKNNQAEMQLHIDTLIDFETLYDNAQMIVDDDFENDDDDGMDDVDDSILEEYYYLDDDDEYEFLEDDSMDEEELREIHEQKEKRDKMPQDAIKAEKDKRRRQKVEKLESMKKARQEKMAKKARDSRGKRGMEKRGLEKLRAGEPLQKTYQIEQEGWYRFCISPVSQLIEVEMELRKSSEVGKPNTKTGHLSTYEHHEMQQHEKKLMKRMNNQNLEANGVKEKDLEMTRKQITKLHKLLYEIKEGQMHERHRLAVHNAVNEHSHSRMVMNSLFETIFYIGVSAFQVYTIRKWFTGSPILSY